VLGLYNASKFAVEGLSETLAQEVKRFGINVTLVEPNQYATDWAGASASATTALPVYDGVRTWLQEAMTEESIGIPEATTPAILQLIDSDNPPLRLLLGNQGQGWIRQVNEGRYAEWDAWQEVSVAAHGK
jgi:NAD(P)-dependent dehydrogenase (short-subunit alcohol dehydrogenase family)